MPTATAPAVYDDLRSSIVGQGIRPGSTVTESAVAERFGVSRPTAKVAIERLVSQGILAREKHHAARVPRLDRHDIADLYECRAVIEAAAISSLSASGAIPAAALDAHRALLHSAETGGSFAPADIAFHRELVSGQSSPRLARMHALLMGEIELCIGQVQADGLLTAADVAAQHQGILDAVTAGNADAAARLTREHIEGARDKLLAQWDLDNTGGNA